MCKSRRDLPWITPQIVRLIRKRDQLYTKLKQHPSWEEEMEGPHNGVARIFFWGGPPGTFSSPLREPTAFSGGGGGVVAEIFRDLDYRIGFSGGGGSSRNFP